MKIARLEGMVVGPNATAGSAGFAANRNTPQSTDLSMTAAQEVSHSTTNSRQPKRKVSKWTMRARFATNPVIAERSRCLIVNTA